MTARRQFILRALVVGLLIGVGAFGIDMYLPGFAAIAAEFGSDPGTVQLSMTSFFFSLGIGQVVWGPLSDTLGRRGPIFAGLAFFAGASVLAAFAPSIGWLIAARFLQGFGAAGATVVPLAVIHDEYTGPDAAKLLSLAMLALSVSPILAPVSGGLLVQYGSWRLIFAVLIAISLAVAVLTYYALPETHPPAKRVSMRVLSILLTYGRLLRNKRFLAPMLVTSFGQALLFLFIAGAPFLIVSLHGVSPAMFGVLFAMHAIAIIGISQTNAWTMRRWGAKRTIGAGVAICLVAALALAGVVLGGVTQLWPVIVLTVTIFAGLGLTLGPGFVVAMEPFGATAGAAAAIGTAVEFACSSTATGIMGVMADGTAVPMAVLLAVCAGGALACFQWFARIAA